jgi:DNA polymerase-3 subunit beta
MEFQIEKKNFLKSLSILQSVADKHSSILALSNILIESEKDVIRLITTDLETTIISFVPCKIKEDGKICVSARKMYEIIRELPESEISIKGMENHWAKITCENALFNLSGIDPNEFPTLPSYSENDLIEVKDLDLREMIEKVIFAASTEESRYNLNGIFLENVTLEEKDVVRMVATDGHRLGLIDRESQELLGIKSGAIIPKRGLNEVKKIVGEYPDELEISISENNFIVKVSSYIVIIRLIDGEFPDYKQVIPKENDKKIKLNNREFSSCLKRVSTISADRVEGVKFTIKKGGIELYSSNQDLGNAMEEFPAIYEGTEMNIGFNGRYIIDALSAIDEDEFLLELKDETSAAIIRPAVGKDLLYVIMPMRV